MRRTARGYSPYGSPQGGGYTTGGGYATKVGFTLIELLVVISIIAILAAVFVLIINPVELTKRTRDAKRLTELANLRQAISVSAQEATQSAILVLCHTSTIPCSGKSQIDNRNSNGTGWVKVDLGVQKTIAIPTLPTDPINDNSYHYSYCSDGENWEINTVLESEQQSKMMVDDGGNEENKYEIGSDLTLIAPAGGSCIY